MTAFRRPARGLTPFEQVARVNHAGFPETTGSDPAKEVERFGY